MSRELRLMTIPEILEIATRSVDFQGMDGLNWWTIFSGKVSHSHFDAIVDEIQANGFGMPIVLCDRYNDGNYWIGNGHHRLCAAILLGLWRIPVMVTSGMDRDDYMCQNDSMDDYGRPLDGYSFEYWGMLQENMEADYENFDENAESEGGAFFCDDCYDDIRVSDECCQECHNDAVHQAKCEMCGYEECICAIVTPDLDDWHYLYCQDCDDLGYALRHRGCAIPRVWDEAHAEDWGYEAEKARMIEVGAILPDGMWHPLYILNDAYDEHAQWLADMPLREARRNYEQAIADMREAVLNGAGEYLIAYWAGVVNDARIAYDAL